ncbi:hypothetical protein EJP67_02245 [Variovorax guangxiensis]|uniref:Uncharacterized protein n=1 Tax=Variovorax guangxiensis TaxID=1775474 RepID=A0A3S0ZBR9_9BURK|nr:hypothetical protein [Variovorax guangxiensis]RUR65874.1 hypothetical protein EJP67_02245 [Variovorax guangxiensis]
MATQKSTQTTTVAGRNTPTSSTRNATREANSKQSLNASQLRLVLQTVALRADTARKVLAYSGSERESRNAAIDAVDAILAGIGAITDGHSGTNVVGDADRWNFGPHFACAGKEVDHE